MKINDLIIPAVILDAFGRLADRTSGKTLLLMASDKPTLFYGHRVIEKNIPIARDHLKKSLLRMSTMDELTRALLQTGCKLQGVISTFSAENVVDDFADFAAYFGEADFLAAALLEDNELIRDAAIAFMAQWNQQDSAPSQRELAKTKLRENYREFLKAIDDLAHDVPASIIDINAPHKASDEGKQAKALDAAHLEIQRLKKQLIRESKEAEEQSTRQAQQLATALRELAAAQQSQDNAITELETTQATLSELQETYELRVYTEIDRTMADRLHQWLAPAQALETTLLRTQHSDIISKANQALQAQREHDRHFGNKAQLKAEIAERQQLLFEIQSARAEALNPLPSLSTIADQLEAEIVQLQQSLSPVAPVHSEVASRLRTQINEATELDRLLDIRHFIQQADSLELLKGDELRQIYQMSDNKACQLYAATSLMAKEDRTSSTSYFHLRQALQQQQAFMLLIDGHNVLYSLGRLFAPYFEQGHPTTQAHRVFAETLSAIFIGSKAAVRLYFDSSVPDEHDLNEQVRIVYSGGSGANRADNAVVKHLQFLAQTQQSQPVCLVTKDHDFARQAKALGAIIMHPEELAITLDLTQQIKH